MKIKLFLSFTWMLAFLAACDNTEIPVDWNCYTYRFAVDVKNSRGEPITLTAGNWQAGFGVTTVNNELIASWEELFFVEVKGVSVAVQRPPDVEGDIDIQFIANVFGLSIRRSETLPAALDYAEIFIENNNPLETTKSVTATVQTDKALTITSLKVYVNEPSPFPENSCNPNITPQAPTETATPDPLTPTSTPDCALMCEPQTFIFNCSSQDDFFNPAPWRGTGVCPDRLHFPVSGNSGVEISLGDRYRILEVYLEGWNAWDCPQMKNVQIHAGSQISNPQNMSGSMANTFPPIVFNPIGVTDDKIKITGYASTGGNCSSDYLGLQQVRVKVTCACDDDPTATLTPTPTPTPSPTRTPIVSRTPGTPNPSGTPRATVTSSIQTRTPNPSSTPRATPTPPPSNTPIMTWTAPPTGTIPPTITALPTGTFIPFPTTDPWASGTPWGTYEGPALTPMPGTPIVGDIEAPGIGTLASTPSPDQTSIAPPDDLSGYHGDVITNLETAVAHVNELPADISGMFPDINGAYVYVGHAKWLMSGVSLQELFGQTIYPIPLHIFYGFTAVLFVSVVMIVFRIVMILIKITLWIINSILKIIPFIG